MAFVACMINLKTGGIGNRGVVIVGGDENLKFILLRGFEDALNVLDGLVIFDIVTHQVPGNPCFAQDIVLRIDNDYCGVILVDIHVSLRLLMFTVIFVLALTN
jgi:hypothetical protein